MPELKEVLAQSYRDVVNDYFIRNKTSPQKDLEKLSPAEQEEVLYQMIQQYAAQKTEMIEQWSTTPLEELQGDTPLNAIRDLQELDEVFEIFTHMACFGDETVPYPLIDKLNQFGQDAVTKLYQMAVNSMEGEKTAEYEFSAAVSALGGMDPDKSAETLIQLAYDVQQKEPQLEQVEDALKMLGKGVIEPLLNHLRNAGFGKAEATLLYVLAFSGANTQDDRIYRLIRNAFRTMEDKMPAIICFSVYGDGRAVPMLRSFLEKNAHDLPDRVFHEMIGTIRTLGGETEDFMHAHHHHQ